MASQRVRTAVILTLIAVSGLALLWTYIADNSQPPSISYSQLLHDAKRITSIDQDGTRLTVVFDGDEQNRKSVIVASTSINVYQEVCDAAGAADLAKCPIDYSAVQPSEAGSIVTTLVISLLPVLLIGAVIVLMMRSRRDR